MSSSGPRSCWWPGLRFSGFVFVTVVCLLPCSEVFPNSWSGLIPCCSQGVRSSVDADKFRPGLLPCGGDELPLCWPSPGGSDRLDSVEVSEGGGKGRDGCIAAAVWLQDWSVAGFPSFLF